MPNKFMSGHMQKTLQYVESNNGVTGSEVATVLGISRPHANSILHALHERNYIRAEQMFGDSPSRVRWLRVVNIDKYWRPTSAALSVSMPTKYMRQGWKMPPE